MLEEPKPGHNFFLYALLLGCLVAIGSSFYFFYYQKDYDFIVETSCDNTKETCFVRDCTNPDDCPPNQLASFKRYSLKAADYSKCHKEDCSIVCSEGVIECEPIECKEDLEAGESCTVPVVEESLSEETIIPE